MLDELFVMEESHRKHNWPMLHCISIMIIDYCARFINLHVCIFLTDPPRLDNLQCDQTINVSGSSVCLASKFKFFGSLFNVRFNYKLSICYQSTINYKEHKLTSLLCLCCYSIMKPSLEVSVITPYV